MSNIVFKGDTIQNFGEFLPNPYIERIIVTSTATDVVNLEIEYSLLFMINDEYDSSDIIEQLNNINLFACFMARRLAQPVSKNKVIDSMRETESSMIETDKEVTDDGARPAFESDGPLQDEFNFYQLDSESIITRLIRGEYDDDLYDSEDRRVLRVSAFTTYELKTTSYDDKEVYCYMLSSLLGTRALKNSTTPKAYLNTSNVAYEKIFSKNLKILRQTEDAYFDTQGSKYGQTPLLALDRLYYKTQNVSRETIIDKVNQLISRFKNRSIGPLSETIKSIEYVLQTEAETENLLVELDKVRRSFPNKTNNNPLGNLYAAYSTLLQNINSAFPASDRLAKQQYLSGKVIDLRGLETGGYSAPVTAFSYPPTQYMPQNMFLAERRRESRDEFHDLSYNSGFFFIKYEEMVKNEANIFKIFNVDKFFEIPSPADTEAYRRMLFSHFRILETKITKLEQSIDPSIYLFLSSNKLTYDFDRSSEHTYTYLPPGVENAPQEGAISLAQPYLVEHNFSFSNPVSNRMLCYSFQDLDSYPGTYEYQQISDNGGMTFDYTLESKFQDSSISYATMMLEHFIQSLEKIQEYLELAGQICSFNNITNKFNDFFVTAIAERYPDEKPWEDAPAIFSIFSYLLTDDFSSISETEEYSKNLISSISPSNGTLENLNRFVLNMEKMRNTQIREVEKEIEKYPVRQDKDYDNTFTTTLLAQNVSDVEAEAEQEIIALLMQQEPLKLIYQTSRLGRYLEDDPGPRPTGASTSTYGTDRFYAILAETLVSFLEESIIEIHPYRYSESTAFGRLSNIVIDTNREWGTTAGSPQNFLTIDDLSSIDNNPHRQDEESVTTEMKEAFRTQIAIEIGQFLLGTIQSARTERNQILTNNGIGSLFNYNVHIFDALSSDIESLERRMASAFTINLPSRAPTSNREDGIASLSISTKPLQEIQNTIYLYYRDNTDKLMRDINKRKLIQTVFDKIPDLTNTQEGFIRDLLEDITIGQYNGPDPEELI